MPQLIIQNSFKSFYLSQFTKLANSFFIFRLLDLKFIRKKDAELVCMNLKIKKCSPKQNKTYIKIYLKFIESNKNKYV